MDIFSLLCTTGHINANNVHHRSKVSSAIRDRAAVAAGPQMVFGYCLNLR
jgi:hypothetical protein